MTPDPPPLPAGRVLDDRFELKRLLGRGGFGIAYLANDALHDDRVVVKELAPFGVRRDSAGVLDLDRIGTSGHVLRSRFLREAEVLRRLQHPGIPALRSAFTANGTAYHVTSYVDGATTLEDRLRRVGTISEDHARELFVSLLDVLEVVHAAGVLHRDVKPSNVLLGPDGAVVLIDFGSAREWMSDGANTQTVMHTPGYAPPEQLSERAPRGPATDLYGVCATVYRALAGKPPPTANDRLAGIPLVPLIELRPDLDPAFAAAIHAGLEIRIADRPESVDALRTLLRDDVDLPIEPRLDRLDDTLVRLTALRFDRRACPACGGVVGDVRPLRRMQCPVCREGSIQKRDLDDRRCPVCRAGELAELDNSSSPATCPNCGVGRPTLRKRSLLSSLRVGECPACGIRFEWEGERITIGDETLPASAWRNRTGRSKSVRICSGCEAQFDKLADGRWRQMVPAPASRVDLYRDEWARVAAGLSPGAGNAVCNACKADYWLEGDRLTLLDAARDPDGYAAQYVGQAIPLEDVRWLGAGKTSGAPGVRCDSCPTEFDFDGEYLRLVASPNRRLSRHVGEPRVMEDWHRIGQDLPTIDQEANVFASLPPMLRAAYIDSELSFDDQGTLWRGKAMRPDDGAEGTLAVTPSEVSFGGLLRKWRAPLDAVLSAAAQGDELCLTLSGRPDPLCFCVLPVNLTAHLRSGDATLSLTAEDLAARMNATMRMETA